MKKGLSVAFAVWLVILCLAGAQAAPDAAALLNDCVAAMDALDSVAMNGQIVMGIGETVKGSGAMLPTQTIGTVDGAVFIKPAKARIAVNAFGSLVETYFEEQDGQLAAYVAIDGKPGNQLEATGNNLLAVISAGLEPRALLERLDQAAELSVEERQFGEAKALCVCATEDVSKILGEGAIASLISMMTGDSQQHDAQTQFTATILAFVEPDTNRLLHVELDLSSALATIMGSSVPNQPGFENAEVEATFLVGVDFVDFDAAQDFEIPAEIKIG